MLDQKQPFLSRKIEDEVTETFCYKILIRFDGKVEYCQPYNFFNKLPPRFIAKIGPHYYLVAYYFASNPEAAQLYLRTERMIKANRGRWHSYTHDLKKKYCVECIIE